MRLSLTREEKKRLTKSYTQNTEAYQFYLKGRHHWKRWTEGGFYKAIGYFQQAVEKDPSYALAYVGVAESYALLGWNSFLPPIPQGKAAAMTALQLDPDLGEAQEALQILDDLTKLAKQKYVTPHFFAGVHIGLGENDRAVGCLEKSYEECSHWLIYLHIDPSMDDLRDDPRSLVEARRPSSTFARHPHLKLTGEAKLRYDIGYRNET